MVGSKVPETNDDGLFEMIGLRQSHLQDTARCFPGLSKPAEATHDGNMSPLAKNMEGALMAVGLDSSIRREGLVAEYGSNAVTQRGVSLNEGQKRPKQGEVYLKRPTSSRPKRTGPKSVKKRLAFQTQACKQCIPVMEQEGDPVTCNGGTYHVSVASGETTLYVAAEHGQMDAVNEMVKYYDPIAASIEVGKGLNAFHIATKQGESEKLKVLIEAYPDLSMTYDASNTTALQTAASQGHKEVVNVFLKLGSGLATIVSSNGKIALHAAVRNGHSEVMKTLPC
ncbi:hypothetical protein Ancab_010346 [Ancistrocladus abbreviatus]